MKIRRKMQDRGKKNISEKEHENKRFEEQEHTKLKNKNIKKIIKNKNT